MKKCHHGKEKFRECPICLAEQRAYNLAYRAKNAEKLKADRAAYFQKNREKIRAANKAYIAKNPEKVKAARRAKYARLREEYLPKFSGYSRKHRTGFTPEDFQIALQLQKNECAICHTPFDSLPSNRVHADHDHKTGALRGVLCWQCNHGLGNFRDDPERLKEAIAYLASPPLSLA